MGWLNAQRPRGSCAKRAWRKTHQVSAECGWLLPNKNRIAPSAALPLLWRFSLTIFMRSTPRILLATLCVCLSASFVRAHAPAVDMLEAAKAFLGKLSPAQKAKATYALTDAERENWNFVPIARQGLPFKEMSAEQHDLAAALLRTGLGQRGIVRAEAIMAMELVLKELENNQPAGRRDPTNYFTTIFGEPSADKSWGWRFEGHHLSFNFTVVDGSHVFFTPSFIGSNPGEVMAGPRKGERVLGEEEDLGLALINSLDEAQRKIAVFDAKAPGEIITTNKHRVDPLSPAGIAAAQLQPAQKAKLLELVKVYLSRCRTEIADAEFASISAAGLDKITFAWAGGFARGVGTYYRVQGPTFLIEFDNTQNNANHIHTTLRDFKGDFGHDLLAEHYAKEHPAK